MSFCVRLVFGLQTSETHGLANILKMQIANVVSESLIFVVHLL